MKNLEKIESELQKVAERKVSLSRASSSPVLSEQLMHTRGYQDALLWILNRSDGIK